MNIDRVYVLCSIDYNQFDVICVFGGLIDAMRFADMLIPLADHPESYPFDWTMKQGDERWDLFINEFTKTPDSGPYLSIREQHFVAWSKQESGIPG